MTATVGSTKRALLVSGSVLLACRPSAVPSPDVPPDAAASAHETVPAPDAGHSAAPKQTSCVDLATALAKERISSAELVQDDGAIDVDGDGVNELVFRGAPEGFSGNQTFLIYRCASSGPTLLGALPGFFSVPHCQAPPSRGVACRLVARVRMLHDDYQDELYDMVDGQYVRTGYGDYVAPRNRR
jgi:hypothetical protein